jgi:hypothetical protein
MNLLFLIGLVFSHISNYTADEVTFDVFIEKKKSVFEYADFNEIIVRIILHEDNLISYPAIAVPLSKNSNELKNKSTSHRNLEQSEFHILQDALNEVTLSLDILEDPSFLNIAYSDNMDMNTYHGGKTILQENHPSIDNLKYDLLSSSSSSTVYVTSLVDTLTGTSSNCNPSSPTTCNLRSAFEYCKSISSTCTIVLPLNSNITQLYGDISVPSSSSSVDIVLQGENSIISGNDNLGSRFLSISGSHKVSMYNLTIMNFGSISISGGAMYVD